MYCVESLYTALHGEHLCDLKSGTPFELWSLYTTDTRIAQETNREFNDEDPNLPRKF